MSSTLIVGTKKGLVVLDAGAKGWRCRPIAHAGIHVSYAFHDRRDGTTWAALDHGHWGAKLSRSKDGGKSWEEVAAPKYPADASLTMCTKKKPALRYMYVLAPGRPQEPGRLYVGTVPGGLFASDDRGATFTLDGSLWNHAKRDQWNQAGKDFDEPGVHSIVVDPRDPAHVYVAVSSAGVLETRDAGRSWQARNVGLVNSFLPDPNAEVGHDPHFLEMCQSEPDVLWQQNHCGVYRSTDAGKTWTDIGVKDRAAPSGVVHFGFAVAADPRNPERAWLVPATSDDKRYAPDGALCAARTEDGGKSWQVLRKGLPQESAYDLVYRHGLALDGDRLVFGTTTGHLYASEDRGDSWTAIAGNLPPINSVRFA